MSSVTLSGSPINEDNYRHSIHDSSSSQDSYNLEPSLPPPPPTSPPQIPPPPDTTEQCLSEELRKEITELKKDLKKKVKEIDKQKAKIKEQSSYIEELKAENKLYKSKMENLEMVHLASQLESSEQITKYDSHNVELEKKVTLLELRLQKVMQDKESLKRIVQGSSMIPTRDRGPPSSRPQLLRNSLAASESSLACTSSISLNSINEIEELKTELNKKDAVIHSKLDYIVQMCKDMQEPSKLRKWHSDMKLVQHHHQKTNSLFMHSQT